MSAPIDRLAAQMRRMEEFAAECEPLPQPGQLYVGDGSLSYGFGRPEAALPSEPSYERPFRVRPTDPIIVGLSADLNARMSSMVREVQRKRAQVIEDWFLGVCAERLGCTVETLRNGRDQAVAMLRDAGIRLVAPVFDDLPDNEEIYIVLQGADQLAAMRFRLCLGSDGCQPLPVEFEAL